LHYYQIFRQLKPISCHLYLLVAEFDVIHVKPVFLQQCTAKTHVKRLAFSSRLPFVSCYNLHTVYICINERTVVSYF